MMGRESHHRKYISPLCFSGNRGPNFTLCHFVAPLSPRLSNSLATEIRATTVTGERLKSSKLGPVPGLFFFQSLVLPVAHTGHEPPLHTCSNQSAG